MSTLPYMHREISWSTRIYALLAVLLVVGAFIFNAWGTNWGLTIALALAGLLLFEAVILSALHHPRTWHIIGWTILLILLGLLLIALV